MKSVYLNYIGLLSIRHYRNHYYLKSDNDLWEMVFDEKIKIKKVDLTHTFHYNVISITKFNKFNLNALVYHVI